MNQKEWYEKLLNYVETDTRLDDMHEMQLIVLSEHLANEESGLTQRAADLPERCPKCEHIVTRHAHDCPRHHENTASR